LSYEDAISGGLMNAGDVPDTRAAIRSAVGVMQEGQADALIRELDVRDALLELGVDEAALEAIDMEGIGDANV
jgi:hypothetical protein